MKSTVDTLPEKEDRSKSSPFLKRLQLKVADGPLAGFQSRNFSLYFFGQGLSMIGTWMTKTVTIWLIYQMTQSPLLIGIIAFFSLSPSVIFAPLGGLIADKKNRHQILIVVQIVAAIRSSLLAILALTNHLSILALFLLTSIQALIEAIENPTRQTFFPTLIRDKKYLTNAIALNSILVSVSRLIGPAIAGVLLAKVGAEYCFLADSLSYLVILASLLAMRNLQQTINPVPIKRPWKGITSGFSYAFESVPIRTVLINLAIVNLCATPIVITLGPIFADKILGGGPEVFGLFATASGVGGIVGALILSGWSTVKGLDRVVIYTPLITGLVLFGLSQCRMLGLALFLIALIGFLLIIQVSASNTILQTISDEAKRGRIMSLFYITNGIMLPCGNLLAGAIADIGNVPIALLVDGAICIASVIYLAPSLPELNKALSQAYQQ